jgi:hypothetical protein
VTLPDWYVFCFVQLVLNFVWQCIVFATCKLIISIVPVIVNFLGTLYLIWYFIVITSDRSVLYVHKKTGVNWFSLVFPNGDIS